MLVLTVCVALWFGFFRVFPDVALQTVGAFAYGLACVLTKRTHALLWLPAVSLVASYATQIVVPYFMELGVLQWMLFVTVSIAIAEYAIRKTRETCVGLDRSVLLYDFVQNSMTAGGRVGAAIGVGIMLSAVPAAMLYGKVAVSVFVAGFVATFMLPVGGVVLSIVVAAPVGLVWVFLVRRDFEKGIQLAERNAN